MALNGKGERPNVSPPLLWELSWYGGQSPPVGGWTGETLRGPDRMMGEVGVSVGAKNKSGGALQEGEHWAALALQSSEPGLSAADSSSLI